MQVKKNYFELVIGIIIIFLSLIFTVFVIRVTNKKIIQDTYALNAIFENIEGINIGSKVKIGGTEIGKVSDIKLDGDYNIVVKLAINQGVRIPSDSSIKISTSGIMGGKYLKVIIGGDSDYLRKGNYFEFTESSLDLEDMITRFMLNKVSNEKK